MSRDLDLTRAATVPFSASDGHRDLFAMAGAWEGPTRTWFDPSAAPDESVTTAAIELILGGRFLRLEYQGTVMGESHAGEMLIGYEPEEQRFISAWVDSFHMSPSIMMSTGDRRADGAISVLGGHDFRGQRWGWRTLLRLEGDEHLVMEGYNISPQGREDQALETRLARRAARLTL
jgi:hypothetical protein